MRFSPWSTPTSSAASSDSGGRSFGRCWSRGPSIIEEEPRSVARLRSSGARFRNDVVGGFGGRQILLEDPSGNPIELFEPPGR